MHLIPGPSWPQVVLAVLLASDVLMSVRPPGFIRVCLEGVGLPREWWWVLLVPKTLAVVGLLVGISHAGIGFSANAGVVVYFLCASYAHVRARFLKQEFWVNCLGFLAVAVAAFVVSFVA
ncbi:DoxX family protein [Streptomyces sp. NPDC049040]|uniref:DoxX family protein n=1 Tax=Streptomyces sp. NPDC049040 TaxID=3365593 RepID=UPI00371CA2DC